MTLVSALSHLNALTFYAISVPTETNALQRLLFSEQDISRGTARTRRRETARPENNVSFPFGWIIGSRTFFDVLILSCIPFVPTSSHLPVNMARRTLTLMHLLLMRFRQVFRLMVIYLSLTTQHRLPRRCNDVHLRAFFRVYPLTGSITDAKKLSFCSVKEFRYSRKNPQIEKNRAILNFRVNSVFFDCLII